MPKPPPSSFLLSVMSPGPKPKQIKSLQAVGMACLIFGIVLMSIAFLVYTPIDQSYAALGMLGGFLLWCVVVFFVRLKAESVPFASALAAYGVGIGPGILCAGGMFLANGALDPNDLVDVKVEIVDKWASKSSKSSNRSSHVRVSDWREGRESETATFQLYEPELFEQLGKGDQVVLRVGPGLFGWWYEGIQPAQR